MRKLRVGVWIQPDYKPEIGGGYGYNTQMIKALSEKEFTNSNIVFLSDRADIFSLLDCSNKHLINWKEVKVSWFRKVIYKIGGLFGFLQNKVKLVQKANREHLLEELKSVCDLIYYPVPGCAYPDFPFILTIWDLGYLTTFPFPEVINQGVYEYRKKTFDALSAKALYIICESETGKKEVIKHLVVNAQKVGVLQMIPGIVVSPGCGSLKPSIISDEIEFIHYPAQFWSHKNHHNLINAFKIVSEEYRNLKLVLCGTDKGNESYIQSLVISLGLSERVIFLGFISDKELKWLYLNSKGLVYPSMLGPTNMPPLEALRLGCPVAVSDLPGHVEQLGNHALYFNPLDANNIAAVIMELIKLPKGVKIDSLPSVENNMNKLDQILEIVSACRFTWE